MKISLVEANTRHASRDDDVRNRRYRFPSRRRSRRRTDRPASWNFFAPISVCGSSQNPSLSWQNSMRRKLPARLVVSVICPLAHRPGRLKQVRRHWRRLKGGSPVLAEKKTRDELLVSRLPSVSPIDGGAKGISAIARAIPPGSVSLSSQWLKGRHRASAYPETRAADNQPTPAIARPAQRGSLGPRLSKVRANSDHWMASAIARSRTGRLDDVRIKFDVWSMQAVKTSTKSRRLYSIEVKAVQYDWSLLYAVLQTQSSSFGVFRGMTRSNSLAVS